MHIGTMRNNMRTCAQYGIVGVPITIFFQWYFKRLQNSAGEVKAERRKKSSIII
jgi:hypothetical protein